MSETERHLKLCWSILPEVSRSFSICINKLPRGIGDRVMVGYLILRIVDTIEDCDAELETKKRVFAEFIDVLKSDEFSPARESELRETLLGDIDHTYEYILLENVSSVLNALRSFSPDEKRAITDCAGEMAGGMTKFQTEPINNFQQQEEYCYYVAGVVGKMDNKLFHLGGEISADLRDELANHSSSYGIGLQKVNVLRDVAYDIPMGRHFWPSDLLEKHGLEYETICLEKKRTQAMRVLREMVENALPYLDSAVEYITRLPKSAARVRVFCTIPLFMAIQSYAKCVDNENVFRKGKKVKISKKEVRKIIRLSFLLVPSNRALRKWYANCLKSVKTKLTGAL